MAMTSSIGNIALFLSGPECPAQGGDSWPDTGYDGFPVSVSILEGCALAFNSVVKRMAQSAEFKNTHTSLHSMRNLTLVNSI